MECHRRTSLYGPAKFCKYTAGYNNGAEIDCFDAIHDGNPLITPVEFGLRGISVAHLALRLGKSKLAWHAATESSLDADVQAMVAREARKPRVI